MHLGIIDAAVKVNTGDNVAPLIRTTHLQYTPVATVKLYKVICLQDHVREFRVGNAICLETPLDGFTRQHRVQ